MFSRAAVKKLMPSSCMPKAFAASLAASDLVVFPLLSANTLASVLVALRNVTALISKALFRLTLEPAAPSEEV
jgi:hypothetical protein